MTEYDKRKFIRVSVTCCLTIEAKFTKSMINAYTQNIGEGGLKVIIKGRLPNSSLVNIVIFLENKFLENKTVSAEGRILYTLKSAEGHQYYITGIEFCSIKESDRSLIKKFVNHIIEEREKHAKGIAPISPKYM